MVNIDYDYNHNTKGKNLNRYLLSTYYMPGTVLSPRHVLTRLVLPRNLWGWVLLFPHSIGEDTEAQGS